MIVPKDEEFKSAGNLFNLLIVDEFGFWPSTTKGTKNENAPANVLGRVLLRPKKGLFYNLNAYLEGIESGGQSL